MSERRTSLGIAVASLLLLAAAGGAAARRIPAPAPLAAAPDGDSIRDQDIAFYQARIARDPEGALDRSMLGNLFLQRARETGSLEDLVRAEDVARASFRLRSRKNGTALHVLALSLLGQHRYAEALEEVRVLTEDDPDNLSYRALQAEIEMELGRYAEAEAGFDRLRSWSYKLTVAPRLARWEELNGRPEQATRILEQATADALSEANLPREQKAWFLLRVGDLAFRYGRVDRARAAWRSGLEYSPTDHRLLAAMSRLESSRREWEDAIRYGELAVAQSLDPATLGVLADAYAALGDTARSAEYARTMELVVLGQPGAYHRAWSLYLLDHDRQVASVLANVEEELRGRKDIYGYDLLAWALFKNGRPCEARDAMNHALALGTREPLLLQHDAIIRRLPCPKS